MPLRELKRALFIYKVFLQHGLDDFLQYTHRKTSLLSFLRICFFFWRNQHREKSLAQRTNLVLQTLGPVYIKFGQMLSTRRDLLNKDWAEQLCQLQDQVAPFDVNQAKKAIEQELGCSIENVCSSFDEKPLASASIAQVHTGILRDSKQGIVFKIQRPHIKKIISDDLDLMQRIACYFDRYLPQAKALKLPSVVSDYRQTILNELDFSMEAKNTEQLRHNFKNSDSLYIPKVYKELSTKSLLVLERIDGIMVNDINRLKAHDVQLKSLAKKGVEIFFTQVFRDNFFHADMHPGNIFVSKANPNNPSYIGLDCAVIGTLQEQDKHLLAQCFLAFFQKNYKQLAQLFLQSGWMPSTTRQQEFEQCISELCLPLFQQPLAEISFGQFLMDLFRIAQQFELSIQPQLILLQKTLLYVEGLGRQLDPDLDLWETAQPFFESWIKEQVGFQATLQKTKQILPKVFEKFPDIPDLVLSHLEQSQNLLTHHDQLWRKYCDHQATTQVSLYWLISAGFIFVGSCILWTNPSINMWIPLSVSTSAVLFWCLGWRQRLKQRKI